MSASLNRAVFFDRVRSLPFAGHLVQSQVDGMNAILDACPANLDLPSLAYGFATAFHETARRMQPIEEFGKGAGRAYGAPDPRTGLAYYGRGLVQLTWLANYLKAGTKLGVDLVYHPELALRPDIAAQILFRGMIEGWFTGRKLADYFGPGHSDPVGARHIINGVDCAALIAGYYSYFLAALQAAKALAPPAPAPAPVPAPTKPAPASPAPVVGLWGWLKSKVL